jgi:hypothetical protein
VDPTLGQLPGLVEPSRHSRVACPRTVGIHDRRILHSDEFAHSFVGPAEEFWSIHAMKAGSRSPSGCGVLVVVALPRRDAEVATQNVGREAADVPARTRCSMQPNLMAQAISRVPADVDARSQTTRQSAGGCAGSLTPTSLTDRRRSAALRSARRSTGP